MNKYIPTLLLLLGGMCVQSCGLTADKMTANESTDSLSTANDLKTADLVFVSRPRGDGTGASDLIHVAMLEVVGGDLNIIDATIRHGVDCHPIDTFFSDFVRHDGTLPDFIIKRVPSIDGKRVIHQAKAYLGRPYDVSFGRGTDALYCTELVRESFVTADSDTLFHEVIMRFCDPNGSLPAYWERLFGNLGSTPPEGQMGTTPWQMASSPLLEDKGQLLRPLADNFLEKRKAVTK